jgi:hypothetical protein
LKDGVQDSFKTKIGFFIKIASRKLYEAGAAKYEKQIPPGRIEWAKEVFVYGMQKVHI